MVSSKSRQVEVVGILEVQRRNHCPIMGIEAKPHDKLEVSLGVFNSNEEPKGFSVEITPEPEAPDLIKAKIIQKNRRRLKEFFLVASNRTNKTVCFEVGQL